LGKGLIFFYDRTEAVEFKIDEISISNCYDYDFISEKLLHSLWGAAFIYNWLAKICFISYYLKVKFSVCFSAVLSSSGG
jgi:hypothetical protein